MSINRILIPTDFSPCADKALEFGILLARKEGIELLICHINPIPAGGDAMFFINAEILDRNESDTEDLFKTLYDRFTELKSTSHKFLQETGFSVDKIRDVAKNEKADLIMMGTKGRGNSINAFFGSVAAGIMKRSDIPVLVVPENAYVKTTQNILLATDLDEEKHEASIKVLAHIAKLFESGVHIVHVIKNEIPSEVSLAPDKVMLWAELMKDVDHHYHFVGNDNVQEGIMRYAYENEVQMLALLGKSYSLLDRLFHKSLTKQLVYHSKLPLLVLPE